MCFLQLLSPNRGFELSKKYTTMKANSKKIQALKGNIYSCHIIFECGKQGGSIWKGVGELVVRSRNTISHISRRLETKA